MQTEGHGEPSPPLTIEQWLEAFRCDVINGTSGFAVERSLDGASSELATNIRRMSQHYGFLALFRILDKHPDAMSFPKFLNVLEQKAGGLPAADELKLAITDDKAWLEANIGLIAELRDFRDRQIAHLDKSGAKDVFARRPIGLDLENILSPSLAERGDAAIAQMDIKVARYRRILLGDTTDVVAWRTDLMSQVEDVMSSRFR